MHKLRYCLIVLGMFFCLASTATAGVSVSVGIGLPNVRIGINLPLYPELVPVPGYPVYYAPGVNANYFFYDGMYWVFYDDYWYASSWYNGPWAVVDPFVVPVYILRVPVVYYRHPPPYFRGWHRNAPPRWGDRWGRSWEQRRSGWDRWNRSAVPGRAPLPVYQRQYSGDRYPRFEEQRRLHGQSYRYEPRTRLVRDHLRQTGQRPAAKPQRERGDRPVIKGPQRQENLQRQAPMRVTPKQRGPGVDQRQQRPVQREQRAPRSFEQRGPEPRVMERGGGGDRGRGQDRGQRSERGGGQGRGGGQERGHGQGREEGRGR